MALESWLKELANDVERVLDDIGIRSVQQSLDLLREIENMIRLKEADFEGTELVEVQRALLWIILQRAAILNDCSRFTESLPLLLAIRGASREAEMSCETSGECFLDVFLNSTLEVSLVTSFRGDFNSAIWMLKDLAAELNAMNHELDDFTKGRMIHLADLWGDSMGYDDAALRTGLRSALSETLENGGLRTRYPQSFPPLRGAKYWSYLAAYLKASQCALAIDASNVTSKLEAQRNLLEAARVWATDLSYSVTAREYYVRLVIQTAEVELKADRFDDFDSTWGVVEDLVADLLEDAKENVYLKRGVAQSLRSIAVSIHRHEFHGGDRRRFFIALASLCIATAESILEGILGDTGATQAMALESCVLSAVAAISRDAFGDRDGAEMYRRQRNAILSTVMRLDPHNDWGRRLTKRYEASISTPDPDLDRRIEAWPWNIVPLFDRITAEREQLVTSKKRPFWISLGSNG